MSNRIGLSLVISYLFLLNDPSGDASGTPRANASYSWGKPQDRTGSLITTSSNYAFKQFRP
ncbi:hypothetical protein [Nostoc sp.]|uniref:hypothetical protein n=1 Tax=Nostoc sp. TaxID=1180 RepID=UPI002FF9FDE0